MILKLTTPMMSGPAVVRLQELLDPRPLVSHPQVWAGDDWELFVAAARAKPYRQLGVAPNGRCATNASLADKWPSSIKTTSDTAAGDRWVVQVAIPLAHLIPGGLKPGGRFYANFYRASPRAKRLLAWSPNFVRGFHELSRLGEFTLE